MTSSVQTVLFDLDGTLLDTAPDLSFALNQTLKQEGLAPLPHETIRPMVSYGSPGLMRLAFADRLDDADYERIRDTLLAIYADNLSRETRLFSGMDKVLDVLESNGQSWGVVTNKPKWLTEPLMQQLNLAKRAATIVSGDDVANTKPHPESLLLACQQAAVSPAQCIYIGDAERDIRAGKNAGMRTLTALYGYIPGDQTPSLWGADSMIDRPEQILDWLQQHG